MEAALLVEFTEYALRRMLMRDILREEVIAALQLPSSRHRPGKVPGRREVSYQVRQRMLLVVYRRRSARFIVINAMWE